MNRDNTETPIAYHAYLLDSSGGRLPFYRLSEELCPSCSRSHPTARLAITFSSRDERAETVHCTLCDYTLTRPFRDPPGRRMNSGQ